MINRAAILDAFSFFALLSARKVWNAILLKSSFFISVMVGRNHHKGMPQSLSVEPITACNLRCPECPSGLRQFTRDQGMMEAVYFRNIIDQLKGNLSYLMLYFQGEPLLNPDLFDMVSYAVKMKVYTATSTNAHYLDEVNARKLVESGLHRVVISMDGTDQDTYSVYRIGGDFSKVREGVENIVRWKKELRSSRPYVIIQFIVFKHNEHQIPAIKKLAHELGADKLELKSAQVYNYTEDTDLIPDTTKYSRYIRDADGYWTPKKPWRNRCFRMWSGAVIAWDGRVVPCCFDKDAEHQLGMLHDHSFKEIWRSEAYDEFRMKILKDRKRIDICRNCTE